MTTLLVPAPLPARVEPQPDEDVLSLVRRSAIAMGYHSTEFILRPQLSQHHISAVALTRLMTDTDYCLLGQLLNLDVQAIGACTVHRWSQNLLSPVEQHAVPTTSLGYAFLPKTYLIRHFLPATEGRICPRCLAEDPIAYGRVYWALRELVTCPWHGTFLLRACPTCGEVLRMTRRNLARCEACDTDLRLSSTIPAPDALVSGNIWLLHRLGNHTLPLPPLPTPWQQVPWTALPSWLSLSFVFDLAVFLWKYTSITEGRLSQRSSYRKGLRSADTTLPAWCDVLTFSYEILSHWPDGMVQLLHRLDQEQLYIPFTDCLRRWHRRAPDHPWLLEVFTQYLHQERLRRAWKPIVKRGYPSPITASKNGTLVSRPFRVPFDEWISDRWLAKHILGVPVATVQGLVERKLLDPNGSAPILDRTAMWFHWNAIQNWVQQLMRRVQPASTTPPGPVMRLCDFEPDDIAALIEAIFLHRLPLWIAEPHQLLCHALVIPATLVPPLTDKTAPQGAYLSEQEAAVYLRCSLATLKVLRLRGFLRLMVRYGKPLGLPRSEVLQFHATYELADNAARESGMTIEALLEWQRYLPALVAARLRLSGEDNQQILVLRRNVMSAVRQQGATLLMTKSKKTMRLGDAISQDMDISNLRDRIARVQSWARQLAREETEAPMTLPKNLYVPFLETWRRKRNWKHADLAKASGISVEALRALERCTQRATTVVVERLAVALDIPAEYLVYGI